MTRSNSASGDEAEAHPKLSPLPVRAYPKPSDIDPLSPPEEEATYSDDEFVTLTDTNLSPVHVETVHENTRFYGKSSVVLLTSQAVGEKRDGAGTRIMSDCRKQFWAIPDVS
jgi:hypothetical protein